MACSLYTDNCDVEYVFALCFLFIAFLLTACALLHLLHEFYCLAPLERISRKRPILLFRFPTLAAFLCGLLCIAFDLWHLTAGWLIPQPLRGDYFKMHRVAANVFGFQAYIFADLVIFGRLYFSFSRSDYQISRKLLALIVGLLLAIVASDLLYLAILISDVGVADMDNVLLVFILFEVAVSLAMSSSFSYKLHQVLRHHDDEQASAVRRYVELDPIVGAAKASYD